MKTFKVGDKVKIPKTSTAKIANFKSFLQEMSNYKLDYLIVRNIDNSGYWEVSLKRNDGINLFEDGFNAQDLEYYEEYNETFNPEAHSSLIIDFDKHELLLTEAIDFDKEQIDLDSEFTNALNELASVVKEPTKERFDKIETIEEAGNKIFEEDSSLYEELIDGVYSHSIGIDFLKRFAIKLAKSDAARNYWFKIFQEEQKPNVQLIDSKQLNK